MPEYIVVNDDLRTMQIPSSIMLLGVESDDDVNKIPFQMPKVYCGFDLSTFQIRINYMNAHGDGDIYIADDVAADGDNITFTWLVGRNACAYKGSTRFIVCAKKFANDDTGEVLQEFNTTVYSLPVLEGLETTDAVVQQNPDIIEHILKLIEESGIIDPDDYYTKNEVNALIPTELPNPEPLIINGSEYDGSEEVVVDLTPSLDVEASISGKLLHVVDAVPQAAEDLVLYDSGSEEVPTAVIAITNKNLFRLDLIADSLTSKGITFVKQSDGSVVCTGTSSAADAMTSCSIDKNAFEVGNTYVLSSGKYSGFAQVQIDLVYADSSTETITAKNSATAFTIEKAVASCTGSIAVAESGTSVSNEAVYAQLEIGSTASAFAVNAYEAMTFNGSRMPDLPDAICNLYPVDDTVASMSMTYLADTVLQKIDEYVSENVQRAQVNGSLGVRSDGNGTVYIFVQ